MSVLWSDGKINFKDLIDNNDFEQNDFLQNYILCTRWFWFYFRNSHPLERLVLLLKALSQNRIHKFFVKIKTLLIAFPLKSRKKIDVIKVFQLEGSKIIA